MRYVTRPRSDTFDDLCDSPLIEARMVMEQNPVKTGLLDKDGNDIWRVMSPVGFVELRERG